MDTRPTPPILPRIIHVLNILLIFFFVSLTASQTSGRHLDGSKNATGGPEAQEGLGNLRFPLDKIYHGCPRDAKACGLPLSRPLLTFKSVGPISNQNENNVIAQPMEPSHVRPRSGEGEPGKRSEK